ncbi:hypothetical protein WMY93_015336 [Mugilogobius chulae]|uniref:Uncharacterized protein n=1 Tax=Mugilogobius chulae TaxID=88201 RepID=A0AAW0NPQ7_9GOBI
MEERLGEEGRDPKRRKGGEAEEQMETASSSSLLAPFQEQISSPGESDRLASVSLVAELEDGIVSQVGSDIMELPDDVLEELLREELQGEKLVAQGGQHKPRGLPQQQKAQGPPQQGKAQGAPQRSPQQLPQQQKKTQEQQGRTGKKEQGVLQGEGAGVEVGREGLKISMKTCHPSEGRKFEWTFKPVRPILILGSSNVGRVPPIEDSWFQMEVFPGAKLQHVASLLSRVVVAPQVQKVLLNFGLNDRDKGKGRVTLVTLTMGTSP